MLQFTALIYYAIHTCSQGNYIARPLCTEVRFASFRSDGIINAIIVNPPERKLAKRTSVKWVSENQVSREIPIFECCMPSSIYSWSIEPLSLLHSKLEFE